MNNSSFNVETMQLDCGARVIVIPMPESPTVAMQLAVSTGSVHEEEYLGCGLSHFLEHMLFQGTRNYPGLSGSDRINALGGDNNAFTSYYQTVYHLTVPAANYTEALDILSDMACYPLFPEDKFNSEKQVILHERAMRHDDANSRLVEEVFSLVFREHPARYPIIGYLDKINSVSREMMADYFCRRYRPHLSAFVVVGPVTPEEVYEFLQRKLAGWERGVLKPVLLPEEPPQRYFRENTCYFNDPLSRLAIGVRIPPASSSEIPALEVLSGVVGENTSSYLVRELHKKSELALNVGSAIFPMSGDGVLMFSGTANPKKYPRMCEAMFKCLEDIAANGVKPEEVELEKNQQIALTLREMRTADDLASQLTQSLVNYGQAVSPEVLLHGYEAVSCDDVNRLAEKYLQRNLMSAVHLIPECRKIKTRRSEPVKNDAEFETVAGGNKLSGVLLPQSRVPLIDVSVIMPGGVAFENEENCGVSRLISNVIFSGTREFGEERLIDYLDNYAIETSVTCGVNSTVYNFNAPSRFQDKLYYIVKAIFSEPRWSAGAFRRERENFLEQLHSKELSPLQRALDEGRRMIYPGQTLGMSRLGSAAAVKALTVKSTMEFYMNMLAPNRVFAGVGGDFDRNAALDFMADFAAALPWSDAAPAMAGTAKFVNEPVHRVVELPREQCAAVYMVPGCDNLDGDKLAFELLSYVENGLASRVFKRVREDNSLAYSTGMLSNRGFHRGVCAFYAMTSPEMAEQALQLLKEEVEHLGRKGITKEEFFAALASVKLACAEQMGQPESALKSLLLAQYYNLPLKTLAGQLAEYDGLTLGKVNAILKRYFAGAVGVSVFAGGGKALK